MKDELIRDVEALRDSAIQRGSKQGLKIYEMAIKQLHDAGTPSELAEIRGRLRDALVGIDTHGSFTPTEFEIVKRILEP